MKNLNELGVQEMDGREIRETDGGVGVPSLFKKTVWGAIAYEVIDNWSDIKAGLVDGWNGN